MQVHEKRPVKRAGVAGIALRAKGFDTPIRSAWVVRGVACGWVGSQYVFVGCEGVTGVWWLVVRGVGVATFQA
ncbi:MULTISPECIES: hypothetical protein [Yersinia pseudotuberculosis complex]|uniref:hypothetical protein n=1 Tax=Yersinia pseudotuberculosis complex TaxID=1649845 RepID=UPI00042A50CF|nr:MULTISPECIES: hypothetical protein [Yersinia pseudotuberculosis complex]